jgi:SAM-dependent methyltransferase
MKTWEEVHAAREWGTWPDADLIRFVKGSWRRTFVDRAPKVLELGCGAGANLRLFADVGAEIGAVDISPSAVTRAAANLESWRPGWTAVGGSVDEALRVESVEGLPWPEATFDLVVDVESLGMLPYDLARAAYAEAWRVTRPSGVLFTRTFSWETFVGDRSAEVSQGYFAPSEGPMVAVPPTRLTRREQLSDLLGPWQIEHVDLVSRVPESGPNEVHEYVIVAKRSEGP